MNATRAILDGLSPLSYHRGAEEPEETEEPENQRGFRGQSVLAAAASVLRNADHRRLGDKVRSLVDCKRSGLKCVRCASPPPDPSAAHREPPTKKESHQGDG